MSIFVIMHQKEKSTHVVETGIPIAVAIVSQVEDPTKAQTIPNIKTAGWASKASTLTILFLIVSATRPPTKRAPPNSITEAIIIACIRVSEREETEVAKELATSFAPIFQASYQRKESMTVFRKHIIYVWHTKNANNMPMAKR